MSLILFKTYKQENNSTVLPINTNCKIINVFFNMNHRELFSHLCNHTEFPPAEGTHGKMASNKLQVAFYKN